MRERGRKGIRGRREERVGMKEEIEEKKRRQIRSEI